MALTGNKGEWSEIYALLKLLGDGKVHAGDAKLNKLKNLYYPILDIIRKEKDRPRFDYKPQHEQNIVVIFDDGTEFKRIPVDQFIEQANALLHEIRTRKDRAFPIPNTETFMHEIGCTKLKAASQDKSDIHIVIHDLRTNMNPLLGFSIKSQLGSPSTLLNAGKPTNFIYKVEGGELNDKDIAEINNIEDHLHRMQAIVDKGCQLVYNDMDNATFKNNLLFMDLCMPQFVGMCLLTDNLPNSTSTIKEAVESVADKNPFEFKGKNVLAFYEHKMKVLLLDAALGMTPAKEWLGKYDANGGYLVVKTNGDIVCYHFYNRNDVEDYLYYNTRFERASRKRHGFGSLYRGDDGNVYVKLNLQIRFNK